MKSPAKPLDGVLVIDLTRYAPGPYATMLLADLGAEVTVIGGLIGAVPELSRGKRFISLDLKAEAGRQALRTLVASADVLIEGFRPGVADRLDAGYETLSSLNPRLVYCSLTGYGQVGPRAQEAGHDINYLAISGVLGATGPENGPPAFPLNLLADLGAGGMLAAFGIVTALFERERTGRGRYLDAAMVDGCYSMLAMHVPFWSTDVMPRRGAGMIGGAAPFYRCYACADGRFVAVGALEPKFFANLWNALELGELPDQHDARLWPAIAERVGERFATRTRDEWTAFLAGIDCCVSPVLDPVEASTDSQLQARHRDALPQAPVVPRFAGMPDGARPTNMRDQTREVLLAAGLDKDQIEAAIARQDRSEAGFTWPPKLK